MFERDIDVLASDARLAGTLCLPAESGSFALVLMVHGSGPVDRDENMKGQKLNVFNAVAHHLAADGIASLRFDKRGCGASEGDYYTTGHHQHVDDVGGEKDLQCDPADIAKIAGLAPAPTVQHVIADMTHVLRCDDEPPTLFGSHRLLARPVAPDVLTLVSSWIRSRAM